MNNIDLTVVIPVYNAALLLDRCLDSIFCQKGNYSIQVVLVDDGSSDNSVDIIKKRKEQDQILLLQQENAGPASARNKGLKMAKGRYTAFLDADDFWMPEFIEQTVLFLDAHRDCIAVSVGQKHCLGEDKELIRPSFLDPTLSDDSLMGDYASKKDNGWVLDDFYDFWSRFDHVCTGSLVARTDVLLLTGGQREDMRICEDTEFWLLLATYGRIGFIPQILFVSDGGAIVAHYGWAKYVKRFQNIPSFKVWFNRLSGRMDENQINAIKGNLNNVVCGISRAKICGGDINGAFSNLYSFMESEQPPLIVRIYRLGKFPFYCFSFLYRWYQYMKINKNVLWKKIFK